MTTDFRALIAEMAAELDHCQQLLLDDRRQRHPLADRARAALAEADGPAVPEGREPASVAKQPTDEEIEEWADACPEAPLEEMDPEVHGWRRCFTAKEFSETIRAALSRWGCPAAAPVPVSERLPGPNTKVLAHYFNCLGKGRTICAIWVPAKSRSDDYDNYGDDGFTEYDEEDDKFYWPEGWYEVIENWDELGWVKVDEGEIAYWQPLPKWPANALPLPAPEGGEAQP